MTLLQCNHVITEVTSLLEGMPVSDLLTDPVKKELIILLVNLRLRNETIETSA